MSALAPLEMTAWIAGSVMPGSLGCRWSRCRSRRVCQAASGPDASACEASRMVTAPAAISTYATRREDGAGTAAEVRAGLLDDRGHEPQEIPVAAPSTAARPVTPRRLPPAAGLHPRPQRPVRRGLLPLVPGFTRCRIQRRSRRSLRHFVPLSYDRRGLPALAEVGDVSRMRRHVSDSLKRRRHTQTSPSAQRGPMSNRDSQNHTGPSGY
jgi:hypothetical protein